MEIFSASLDTWSKITTTIVCIITFLPGFFCIRRFSYFSIIAFIVMLGILITLYIYSVNYYQLNAEKLIIKRPLSLFNKEVFLSDINKARLLDESDSKGIVRTFGNGGLFGYSGSFSSAKLGHFTMYATNQRNMVMLILKKGNEKIVLSPDDSSMVDEINKKLLKKD